MWDWRADYVFGTDTTSLRVSEMPSLKLLLLMLAGLAMIVFGLWRLIFSLRQVKDFIHRSKSK